MWWESDLWWCVKQCSLPRFVTPWVNIILCPWVNSIYFVIIIIIIINIIKIKRMITVCLILDEGMKSLGQLKIFHII